MSAHAEKLICQLDSNRRSSCVQKPGITVSAVISYLLSPEFSDSNEYADILYDAKALSVIKSLFWYTISVGAGFLIASL